MCFYYFYRTSLKTGRLRNFLHKNIPSIIIYLQKVIHKNDRNRYRQNHYYPNTDRMSLDEARQILGVSNNTSRDEIMKAFKRLMLINHPDKGGTQYIATKIIQARKTLLGE